MTGSRQRAWWIAAALVLVSCTAPGPSDAPPGPTESVSVWALGDSQASRWEAPGRGLGWPDRLGPAVFNGSWSGSGAGFIRPGTVTGRNIVQEFIWLLERYRVPRTLVVVAGTNDLVEFRTPAAIMNAVRQLEAVAFSAGVTVWYVSVPPFPAGGASTAGREAARVNFNALLAAASPGRFVNCEPQLVGPGGHDLRTEYRLSASDDLHLGDGGLRELARCAARFGAPLVAPT